MAKLNSSYPGQELRPETAVEWFTELTEYPADRVWRAVRRCRREQSFRPTLAELIEAMLLNAQEAAAAPSDRPAIEARDPDSPGTPPPASFRRAFDRLLRRLPPEGPEPQPGRSRDQQLAELEASMQAEAGET